MVHLFFASKILKLRRENGITKKKYLNEQKKNPYETKLTILRIHFLIIFTHFSPLFVAQKTKNVNKELYSAKVGMLKVSIIIQIVKIFSITFRESLNLICDATTLHSFKFGERFGNLVCLAYKISQIVCNYTFSILFFPTKKV